MLNSNWPDITNFGSYSYRKAGTVERKCTDYASKAGIYRYLKMKRKMRRVREVYFIVYVRVVHVYIYVIMIENEEKVRREG